MSKEIVKSLEIRRVKDHVPFPLFSEVFQEKKNPKNMERKYDSQKLLFFFSSLYKYSRQSGSLMKTDGWCCELRVGRWDILLYF